MSKTWKVRDVGKRHDVRDDHVLHWIHTGQLRAVNIAKDPNGQRPRWRILEEDLAAFEATRSTSDTVAPRPSTPRQITNAKDFV